MPLFPFNSSSTKKIYVAHYGNKNLRGAKHWSLLWMNDKNNAVVFQIEGSTASYAVKREEQAVIKDMSALMGMVQVGTADETRYEEFVKLMRNVPVRLGDKGWNCQNWIVQGMDGLRQAGFDIEALSLEALAEKLARVEN